MALAERIREPPQPSEDARMDARLILQWPRDGRYLVNKDLAHTNLTGADLRGAYLTGAYLTGANLTRANLTDANLTDANLTGTILIGATLTRAIMPDSYIARLRRVHSNPSSYAAHSTPPYTPRAHNPHPPPRYYSPPPEYSRGGTGKTNRKRRTGKKSSHTFAGRTLRRNKRKSHKSKQSRK